MDEFERMARQAIAARKAHKLALQQEEEDRALAARMTRRQSVSMFENDVVPIFNAAVEGLTKGEIAASLNLNALYEEAKAPAVLAIVGDNAQGGLERMCTVQVELPEGAWLVRVMSLNGETQHWNPKSSELPDTLRAAFEEAVARWTETGRHTQWPRS